MLASRTFWLPAAIASILLGAAHHAPAETFVPAADDEVLETLPLGRISHAGSRGASTGPPASASAAADADRAAKQALSYLDLARVSGDDRYVGRAAGAIASFTRQLEMPRDIRFARSIIRQRKHEFDAALEDLDALLAVDPRDGRAWFTRSTIQLVKGDPQAAYESCQPLLWLADRLSSVTCLARAAAASGGQRRAFEALATAVARPGGPPAIRHFAVVTLAEIAAQQGQPIEAERWFREARALDPSDPYLIAAFADWLLDQDRPGEVLPLLEGMPPSEGLSLRRVLALRALRDARAMALARTLEARFDTSRERGLELHQGEEARFALHVEARPQKALTLARLNFERQREPRDARILLEAALAAGEPAAADAVARWFHESGLEDVRLQDLVRRIEARS